MPGPIASSTFGYGVRFASTVAQTPRASNAVEALLQAGGDTVDISDAAKEKAAGLSGGAGLSGLSAATLSGSQISVESRQTGPMRFAAGSAAQDGAQRGFSLGGQQGKQEYSVVFTHADGSTQRFAVDGTTRFQQMGNGSVVALPGGESGASRNKDAGQSIIVNVADGATVQGGSGDDLVLNAGRGARIDTGDGNDTILSMGDGASIDGGADDDKITVLKDTLQRATQNSASKPRIELPGLSIGNSDHPVFGEARKYEDANGDPYKTADAQSVTIAGGEGDDTIVSRATLYGSSIDGGNGNNVIKTEDVVRATIKGGKGNNKIDMGVVLASTIEGGNGDDRITARLVKNSTVRGNAGNDVLDFVGMQNSLIDAGAGDDLIRIAEVRGGQILGGEGDDRMVLGTIRDTEVLGGGGNDDIRVNELSGSRVDGEEGNDGISFGRAEKSEILGGEGDDTIEMRGSEQNMQTWLRDTVVDGGAGHNSIDVRQAFPTGSVMG